MARWFDAMGKLGLQRGKSFDLDFHTIPFHGEDALVEKHYVSKRSRRQKGILAFLAQDAQKRVFCYANGQLRKDEQNDEILRFVAFWKNRTGHLPEELIFDSKLTTYPNLNQLNRAGTPSLPFADVLQRCSTPFTRNPCPPGGVESKGFLAYLRRPASWSKRFNFRAIKDLYARWSLKILAMKSLRYCSPTNGIVPRPN